jgi:hypothetical protein
MIIELELGVVIALQMATLVKRKVESGSQPFTENASKTTAPDSTPTYPAEHIEIVKKRGDDWVHVGHRPITHPDIHEAIETPGLALRHSDGRIEEGTK